MKCVGIDIGSYSVKVTEITEGSKGFVLSRCEQFPLSTDPSKDKKIEIIDLLRRLEEQYDPHSTRFIMGVRQDSVSLRRRSFPFRERHKILKSLPFELEDDIPLDQEDAVFDAKVVKYQGNTAEVLATACPKPRIQEMLQLAEDGGLEIDILSVEGLAFGNLFERWQEPATQEPTLTKGTESEQEVDETNEEEATKVNEPARPAQIYLDIGHEKTLLLARTEDSVLVVRSLDWGGRDLVQTIAHSYQMNWNEALQGLKKSSFILLEEAGVTQEQIRYSNTIKKGIDGLAHELQLALLEIQSEFHVSFQSVTLLGGVSQVKNLAPFLTEKLEIATNRLKGIEFHHGIDFGAYDKNQATNAVATGLAIEGLKRPKNPATNLLKGEFARKSQTAQQFWEKWGYSVKVAAAAFVLFFVYGVAREKLSRSMADEAHFQMKNKAQVVADLSGLRASTQRINKFIADKKKQEENREMAQRIFKINSPLGFIEEISKSVPVNRSVELNVKKLSIDNNLVKIEGTVNNPQRIEELAQSLKALSMNGQVRKVKPSADIQGRGGAFAFEFRVKRFEDS